MSTTSRAFHSFLLSADMVKVDRVYARTPINAPNKKTGPALLRAITKSMVVVVAPEKYHFIMF